MSPETMPLDAEAQLLFDALTPELQRQVKRKFRRSKSDKKRSKAFRRRRTKVQAQKRARARNR